MIFKIIPYDSWVKTPFQSRVEICHYNKRTFVLPQIELSRKLKSKDFHVQLGSFRFFLYILSLFFPITTNFRYIRIFPFPNTSIFSSLNIPLYKSQDIIITFFISNKLITIYTSEKKLSSTEKDRQYTKNQKTLFFKKSKKKQFFLFIIALFLFLLSIFLKIRYFHLPLDVDEIHTIVTSKFSFYDIVLGTQYDPGNPPLYSIIVKTLGFVFRSETSGRISSLLFFSILFWTIYFFTKKISTFIVLSSSIFISISVLFSEFSTYGRGYLLLTLASLGFVFSTSYYYEYGKNRYFILSIIFGLIGLYIHYLYAVFLGICIISLLILFFLDKNLKDFKKFLKLFFFIFLFFLPWLLFVGFNQFQSTLPWRKYDFWQNTIEWQGYSKWISILSNYIVPDLGNKVSFILLLWLALFSTYQWWRIRDTFSKKEQLISIIGISCFLSMFFSPYRYYFPLVRYNLHFLPVIMLGFLIIYNRTLSISSKKIIIFFIALWCLKSVLYYPILERTDKWKETSKELGRFKDETVFIFKPCWLGKITTFYTSIADKRLFCFSEKNYQNLKIFDTYQAQSKNVVYVFFDKDFQKENFSRKINYKRHIEDIIIIESE